VPNSGLWQKQVFKRKSNGYLDVINWNEAMSDKIIASLTSYPPRIKTVHFTVKSLLNQTLKTKTILWLSEEEFPNKENDLPSELLDLRRSGLEIEWCCNTKSYKKLIPALEKYWDSVIITFDDDLIYNKKTIEILYKCYKEHPQDIIAHRITRMYYNENSELVILPGRLYYNRISIKKYYVNSLKKPSFFNKFTGVGGILYPPNCLHRDVLDKTAFLQIAPTNDDIWFWLQAVRNNVRVRVPEKHFSTLHYIPHTQDVGLTRINDHGERLFFIQLKNVIEHYPEIKDKLKYDDIENSKVVYSLIRSGINIFINKLYKILKDNK